MIYLDNPKWWLAFCKEIGFLDEEGEPDTRFLRPLRWDDSRESVQTFLPYLTHTGQPDKEPYNEARDLVWGSNKLFEMYQRACNALLEKNVRTSDSCIECLAWIKNHDGFIEFEEFALWACMNTNYKGAASPVIREAIKSHNQRFIHSRDNENGALMAEIGALHDQIAELKRKQVIINVNDFEPLDNVGGGVY